MVVVVDEDKVSETRIMSFGFPLLQYYTSIIITTTLLSFFVDYTYSVIHTINQMFSGHHFLST